VVSNPIEGRVVIDVSRKYVSIFRCDGAGKVVDEDHFAHSFRLDRSDAVSFVVDIYSFAYDLLNDIVNDGPDEDSAREGGPPAKTE
jgi:hypothetical protein